MRNDRWRDFRDPIDPRRALRLGDRAKEKQRPKSPIAYLQANAIRRGRRALPVSHAAMAEELGSVLDVRVLDFGLEAWEARIGDRQQVVRVNVGRVDERAK